MHFPVVSWVLLLLTLFMTAFILDETAMMATHYLTQGNADAAADAGANQRHLTITNDDIHEFVISPIEAQNAASAAFAKNLNNMETMGIETDLIENPTYSFPDQYSIGVSIDLSHEMKFSESAMENVFDNYQPFEPLEDSVFAVSDINHRK
ncbi:hypothetical protein [Cohnella soli]|uniref:Flp pilus-assembly TadG-like N-terminal domain-containing protein n=1 Tax=Cohnella soli TaxID=425005 RepID=A0ABW0HQV4_9BACL